MGLGGGVGVAAGRGAGGGARRVFPAAVAVGDATFNRSQVAKLRRAMATSDLELIAAGLSDRLHQPYRAPLYPRSAELVERAAELGAVGATISGAGPSVLVWCRFEQTGSVMQALEAETGSWATVMRAPFESRGAYVRGL